MAEHAMMSKPVGAQIVQGYHTLICGVLLVQPDGAIRAANAAAASILRCDTATLCTRYWLPREWEMSRPDGQPCGTRAHPLALAKRRGDCEMVLGVQVDGGRRWLHLNMTRPWPDDATFCISFIDVTVQHEAQQEVARLRTTDALTGLCNRDSFLQTVDMAVGRAALGGQQLAVIVLDLDRFKEINDALGHAGGDTALVQIAQRLLLLLRSGDCLARLGSDKFALLLTPGAYNDAQWMAHRVIDTLHQPLRLPSHEDDVQVLGSMGIALYPIHSTDATTLLRQADVAMYAAKKSNVPLSLYDAEQDLFSAARLSFESQLREAISNDELHLSYQPKISLSTGNLEGVEALVRWSHPRHGAVTPDQFIPLAEHTGLIAPLSRWVLDTALHQCRVWQRRGLNLNMAINLPMCVLHDEKLLDTIAWLLRRYGIQPTQLTLEITESALMAESRHAVDVLTRLAEIGVRLAIDDFGVGYSSLSYLKRLPVHEIKIDKSFVLNMVRDDEDASIVSFTIGLGHSLGLTTVAEGVEGKATWEMLAALGCDVAQGYYISPPVPAEEFDEWMARASWTARADAV